MVPFAVGGIVAWAVAGLVLLLFRDWLAEHGHTDWLWICLAGFLLGIPGLAIMIRHDAQPPLAAGALTTPSSRCTTEPV